MRRDNLRQVTVYTDKSRKVEDFHGYFHSWSMDWEELGDTACQYPVGIVEEKSSGDVKIVWANLITFTTV